MRDLLVALTLLVLATPAPAGLLGLEFDPVAAVETWEAVGPPATVLVASPVTGTLLKQGKASWYGPGFHGRKTANGERYDQEAMTAAMTGVPLGIQVRVVRTDTGAAVTVRVNDRGPYEKSGGRYVPHSTRVIDLSKAAMRSLGGIERGLISVQVFRLP